MAKPPPRSIFQFVWKNFVNSLRPRQIIGNLVGEDYFGNKYFEIPGNRNAGQRRQRWFEPPGLRKRGYEEVFDNEITAEWEAWLRGRRDQPPTVEELKMNLTIMKTKEINAAKLSDQYAIENPEKAVTPQAVTGGGTFPRYKEYEITPGKLKKKDE